MDVYNTGKEKLNTPTDYTSPSNSRKPQVDLVPPSHFASSVQAAGLPAGDHISGTQPCVSWMNPSVPPAPPKDPWLVFTQSQEEVSTLSKENQCAVVLRGHNIGGRTPEDNPSDLRTRSTEGGVRWSRWEAEWCLEAGKHKAEAERLKEQMEALKETVQRYREEMRVKDNAISRQSHDLEVMHEEIGKVRTEHSQTKEELTHCRTQKEKISSQLERLKRESDEEIAKVRKEGEAKGEMSRQQEAEKQSLRLSQQLQQMQKKQEEELRLLSTSHCVELGAARKSNIELQSKVQIANQEVLQLKSSLMMVSAERDELKEQLRQTKQANDTQSATLHSLRNYIGQLVPDTVEKEQLNEAVERLNKEKAALQKTAELLTVRLNSMSEIVSLQEEKMLKNASTDPLVAKRSNSLHVLHLWRDKVFKLCVQLRLKDMELRDERERRLSELTLMDQQLQEEQHGTTVLQRSLDARIAELDQEKAEKETLQQDLAQACKESQEQKERCLSKEAELKITTDAVCGFSLVFHRSMAEVDAAQAKLNTFGQRLNFARGRVETVQALFMRRVALHKAQQASKQTEQAAESIRNLQTELSLVCEERSKLTQELKRSPELIEKALADMKEQYEKKLGQKQKELEQTWMELQQVMSEREEGQQNLQQVLAQMEESKVTHEKLRCELLSQKEHSEHTLQERVSEIESRCADKLSEMAVQVNTAKKEHTKAVMTLRQFEREVARRQNHWRETEGLPGEHTKEEVQCKQTEEAERHRHQLLAAVVERELSSHFPRVCTSALQNGAEKPSERSHSTGLGAEERLISVLEELHTLSAAVVNSSEDSVEEEEELS
ncbi:coiled-coil alpha-helical rod protein 1 isoform X2 [Dunckerocampus dactyliophorus]|uniref:coiled-coil alpha-helical rod protein 1 isoform X2 n=1 Tax=Dunckerocampus dactyliophorus TaxID=161453 RepID=UPI00240575F9|nr:coiled-coil alpha-helical rod protein 1 isoform X2 [Dunckerocampus dactyliophorus]